MERHEGWNDPRGGRRWREDPAGERPAGPREPWRGESYERWRSDPYARGDEPWAGYEGGRGRAEIDPPWVERGPEARRRGESRGLVEWEDRGPLEWLGHKAREALGRPHRGPKGYQRSDERIRDDVCERIARSGVDAEDVEVTVENREVTLGGTVWTRREKWRLEEIAEDAYGVEEVHNRLRVRRTAEPERSAPVDPRR